MTGRRGSSLRLSLADEAVAARFRQMTPERLLRLARIIVGSSEERRILERFAADAAAFATQKKQIPHDLADRLAELPPAQRRVAEALVGGDQARTYGDVAAVLGVSVGTVHTHLRRVRERHPDVYAVLMAARSARARRTPRDSGGPG